MWTVAPASPSFAAQASNVGPVPMSEAYVATP